jgi:NADH-quinone oxidoreductase subunit N
MTNVNYAQYFTPTDAWALMPIFIVAATALVILIADLFERGHVRRYINVGLGIAGLIVAAVFEAQQYGHPYAAFSDAYVVGGFSVVFSEIIIIATIFSLLLTAGVGRDDQIGGSTALVLWSAAGTMLMTGAANFMTIFLGLELLSLGLYALCGIANRATSHEAALKYLILSSMASGFMLYGMALLFGATGSVSLTALINAPLSGMLVVGVGLFLVGVAFKLSLFPLHVWAPDVFEGAPLAVTAFMSVVTKAGIFAVLARFAYAAIPQHRELLVPLWILAALSMIFGNLGALAQSDLKRLLAYSGIAQLGYMTVALAGATTSGLRYAIYYLTAYMFMNLGAFAVIALLSRERDEGSALLSFAGLSERKPWAAAAMAFFLLALAGLPPTAGFTGKILILASTVDAGYIWLAALLIVGTAISFYAYIKVIRVMYRHEPRPHTHHVYSHTLLPWVGVAVGAVAVLALGLYPFVPSDVLPLVK